MPARGRWEMLEGAVFGCFLIADVLELKEFGFALAVAVILDATLVRLLLVPCVYEDRGKRQLVAPGIHGSAHAPDPARLKGMHRLGVSGALLAGVVLVFGSSAAGRVKPTEALREQRAVSKISARGLPLYCGGGRTREVALTFDDGPTPNTSRLLDALRGSSWSPALAAVPATFFLIGESAGRYRSYARVEAEMGAVGAHTQRHKTLTRLGLSAARKEIEEGTRSVERAIGAPVDLFRPPGGHRSPAIDRIVASHGLLTVLWSVDPRDWARRSATSIVAALATDPRLAPGAIVVLHDFNLATIEALPAIVHDLRHRGLRPVTVPQLLADDPPTIAEQRDDARAGGCVHLYGRRR